MSRFPHVFGESIPNSPMKLGLVSAILPELTLDEVLALAHREKLACVEVMCWPMGKAERKYAGVTHVDVNALTPARIDSVQESVACHGVSLSALGYYPNPLDPDLAAAKRCVEHLKRVITAAPKLGLRTVNTFVGRDWGLSVEENWPRFLKTWKPIISVAEDHGVRVAIENCPMLFTRDEWPGGKNLASSPAIWRRMFEEIPSASFGLNLDPSHLVLQFMDPFRVLREFRSKLFHVHAKDVRIHQERLDEVGVFAEPLRWHTPRIPGFGELDWPRFLGTLREVGYDGPVCIEVEDDTFGKSLAGRTDAVRVAAQVLRPCFA